MAEAGVYVCIICRFAMELDDLIVKAIGARGVCLRCYERETATEKPMPADLRREVRQAVNEVE